MCKCGILKKACVDDQNYVLFSTYDEYLNTFSKNMGDKEIFKPILLCKM